ncbi:MAG: putative Ig domain-containing protein [Pseudomonadota bacterium]
MQYTKHALAAALGLSLVACGGGGGGGGSTTGGGSSSTPVAANNAPTISGTPAESVNVGDAYSFTPTASDPDGDTLSFALSNAPIWLSINSSTGEVSGNPFQGDIGDASDIQVSVSDGQASASLTPFDITVMPEILGRQNFEAKGDVFPIDGGFQSVGELALTTGEFVQTFANSDLTVTFDNEDKLVRVSGDSDVPTNTSAHTNVVGNVRSIVDVLTGAEINDDPDLDIQLIEDRKYFVHYIGVEFDMEVRNPLDPTSSERLTISTPYGGQSLLIADPTDTFLFRYGSTPLIGAYGSGRSMNGLIPFSPELPYAELDSFNGNLIDKGTMGIGFKYVDLLEVSGTLVRKEQQYTDINWDDILESEIEYKGGFNGDLDFAMSVVGFGLFSFDLAEASGTLDFGFDRQQLALSLLIDPSDELFPASYSLGPTGEITGSAYLNGDGSYGFELDSLWHSKLPEADIGGTFAIENGTVTLTGTVSEDDVDLAVSLTLANDQTVGRVEFPESYSQGIAGSVTEALDRKIAEVEQKLAELEQAASDYEFEVSLRGIREGLPAVMDAAVVTLNGIPGTARSEARSEALSYMRNKCTGTGRLKVCLDDIVDENDIANKAGDRAYDEANDAIRAPKAAMLELKKRALEADDETLREALRTALSEAYNNRNVRIQTSYSRSFGTPFNKSYTIYSRNSSEKVLSDADANDVRTARDNVFRIEETSNILISTQEVVDRLPTEEVIEQTKSEVNEGTANIPTINGLGYRAIGDTYEAFVTIDNEDQDIEINVLKPSDVRKGVSDLLADILLP